MKHRISAMLLLAATTITAFAQDTEKTYYLPGDGMYIVGIPSTMKAVVNEPTIITQAYQSTLKVFNAMAASADAGEKTYNITKYFDEDNSELDIRPFMGVGEARNLTVRTIGASYQIGDMSPNKTWKTTELLAAYPNWLGKATFPLGVYDHWDCPVQYVADPVLRTEKYDALTVDFGNPHEGLVAYNANFTLVTDGNVFENAMTSLDVKVTIWDNDHKNVIDEVKTTIRTANLNKISTDGTYTYYSVLAPISSYGKVINTPFDVTISGFAKDGVNCWLPRAVDTHNMYPSHTTYYKTLGGESKVENTADACINIEGYFNFVGTWALGGKYERGEVYPTGDLVQVYYDPKDPDWEGDFFMGEASFPVECTFGMSDIVIESAPEWIFNFQIDDSQWVEYGALQLIMTGAGLPEDVTGRMDKVVFSTQDGASKYTIYVRQGDCMFGPGRPSDEPIVNSGIKAPVVDMPVNGGTFDILGRRVSNESTSRVYIKGGKKIINK